MNLLAAAAGLFACAAAFDRPSLSAAMSIGGCLVLARVLVVPSRSGAGSGWLTGAAVVVAVATWSQRMVQVPDLPVAVRLAWLTGVVVSGALVLRARGSASRLRAWAMAGPAVVGVAVLMGAFMVSDLWDGVGTDVYLAHHAAADALAAGENPYTKAVSVANGSPYAPPGSVVEGYAYPPITLLAFASSVWVFGDPRWILVLAFGAFTVVLARVTPTERVGGVLTLWAAFPIWPFFLLSAWTEPLTLVLLAGGLVAWSDQTRSGAWAGLGLASKQYLLVGFPLLAEKSGWSNRTRWAMVSGLATVLPFVLWNPVAFFRSVAGSGLSIGFRPDTQSLAGLMNEAGFEPILSLPIALGGVVAATLWVRNKVTEPWQLPAATALVLAVFFWLYLGFPNYWFLVFGLTCLAIAMVPGDDRPNMRSPST